MVAPSQAFRALPRTARGFSIIELMVVVTVVAILAAVVTPSFSTFILGQRVKTAASDLATSMMLARSEAIKRNTDLTIAVKDTSVGWGGGWLVTATQNAVTATLSEQNAYPGLTFTGPASPANVIYKGATGRPSAGKTSFQISGGGTTRCVIVDLSGMTSTKTGGCS